MSTATSTTFAQKLRDALDDKGMSNRRAAHLIDPQSPEAARRNLTRWLNGSTTPSRTSRRRVEAALSLERGSLDTDEPRRELSIDELLRQRARQILQEEARDRQRLHLDALAGLGRELARA